MRASRTQAAKQCAAVFDTVFFKALCEPARITVLQELVLLGRGDIAAIAERVPQDRSVVSRHLRQLAAAGVVRAEKEGRSVFYQIDAHAIGQRLEEILATTRLLESAMAMSEPRKGKS